MSGDEDPAREDSDRQAGTRSSVIRGCRDVSYGQRRPPVTQLAFHWQFRQPSAQSAPRRNVKHVDPRDHQWRKVGEWRNEYVCDGCGAEAWKVGHAMRIRRRRQRGMVGQIRASRGMSGPGKGA